VSKKCMAFALSLCLLAVFGCKGGPGSVSRARALTADVPLHLEDHLDAARIEGSEVPKDLPSPLEWRFDNDTQEWKATAPIYPKMKPLRAAQQENVLRLTLTKENRNPWGYRYGSVFTELPNLNHDDWGFIVIQARTKDDISWISPCFNLREKQSQDPDEQSTFLYFGDTINVIHDGEAHTYILRADTAWPEEGKDPWRQLGISISSGQQEKNESGKGPVSIDILSVSVIPKEAAYAKSKAGTGRESWGRASRQVLYTHVPGKLEYEVMIPERGRLDVGLGLLKKNIPVKFKISAREKKAGAGSKLLLDESYSGEGPRLQRSVDLSALAGRTMILTLEAEAAQPGNVAFWGAPTLSGTRTRSKPNIVFYVIDGASADFMSVYGYNRRTTPHLERLAAEGVVFENAYSNSSWTKVSVPSFMTSLHNSVLGGNKSESDPLPEQAVPMAKRLHNAGYLTEVLTSNPYCGRMSSLDQGVDSLSDAYAFVSEDNSQDIPSSEDLNRLFWDFREAYPAEPYWIHFQPTDVHSPWKPVPPFAGLFATAEERQILEEMRKKMRGIIAQTYSEVLEKAGIDPALFMQINRKLYDESMAYQDHTIGQLVERIKDRGEWENTLFIVAADHGHEAGGLTLIDPKKPKYESPLLAAQHTRIPMIFVWAGTIAPGRRMIQPVSMIDMLPTILDLAGLPAPEISQGQSLAPLLLGKPGWTPRPVVFDEFNIEDDYFFGAIEVIDGRWGASLKIDPRPDDKKTPMDRLRPASLLIFDVWEDPHAFKSLHETRPDLVEKYTKMLNGIWKEHQALAKKFTRGSDVALTPEQIETLRSLGYLR
jgi:arylsulfatase A-like enzyme